LHRGSQAIQLQLGVIGPAVDDAFLKLFGGDLPDACTAHAFFGRDFVIGEPSRSRPNMRLRRKTVPCAANRRRRTGALSSTIKLSFSERSRHLLEHSSE
jgi:hypothetical protein